MNASGDPSRALSEFAASREFFIGIDSDGCVFDTMEVKHKECFIPNIIKCYGLAAISKYVREAAEFINLYSHHRGVNRFPGLVLTMDLLAERAEVLRRRPNSRPSRASGLDRAGDPAFEPGPVRRSDVDRRSRPAPGPGVERGGQSLDRATS